MTQEGVSVGVPSIFHIIAHNWDSCIMERSEVVTKPTSLLPYVNSLKKKLGRNCGVNLMKEIWGFLG